MLIQSAVCGGTFYFLLVRKSFLNRISRKVWHQMLRRVRRSSILCFLINAINNSFIFLDGPRSRGLLRPKALPPTPLQIYKSLQAIHRVSRLRAPALRRRRVVAANLHHDRCYPIFPASSHRNYIRNHHFYSRARGRSHWLWL